jgi:hypothetical protein
MPFKIRISDLAASDINKDLGLYQFIATLSDGTKCRLFYTKNPDFKLTDVNRLQTVPCPVCRKDYYCNCMNRFTAEFNKEVNDRDLISAALQAK